MNKALILLLTLFIRCDKPTEFRNSQSDATAFLTKPDHQAVILISLKHDVDTVKVNGLVQSYLDHFDMMHVILNGKSGDLLHTLNSKEQFRIIDSLCLALSIPKPTSAAILYDYILFTKKCDAEDNSAYEVNPDSGNDY